MEDNNLVILTLDLDIPNLWENALVQNFPEVDFIIKQARPTGNRAFSGLLKIENGNYLKINKFLKKNYPLISLEPFHANSNLFYFLTPDDILSLLLENSRCILNWPVAFLEKGKRIKFILNERVSASFHVSGNNFNWLLVFFIILGIGLIFYIIFELKSFWKRILIRIKVKRIVKRRFRKKIKRKRRFIIEK